MVVVCRDVTKRRAEWFKYGGTCQPVGKGIFSRHYAGARDGAHKFADCPKNPKNKKSGGT